MDRPQWGAKPDRFHRVMIVDRHRAFAEALAAGLGDAEGFEVVAVAFPPAHVFALLDSAEPDILLIDTGFEPLALLELLRSITSERPGLVVLAMSGIVDADEAIAALSQGAQAWVPKSATMAELLEAINAALAGHTWMPQDLVGPVLRGLLSRPQAPAPPSFVDRLTRRQLQVLECLAAGMSRQEIAQHLVVSPHTVRTHVQEILRKAGVHSTLAALALAREAGHCFGEYSEMAVLNDVG